MLRYGSVCSGIEAATMAWHPLGWKPAWFAEIEKFPSAVLNYHYPDVPNLGDMTKIAEGILKREIEAPDVLVGGTPCQDFSVAGLRAGLSGDRGNLTLSYVELFDAIDTIRSEDNKEPAVCVWENVPGCLSMPDNAFGSFLAALVGESSPLEPGPRPAQNRSSKFWRWDKKSSKHIPKWTNCGVVIGPKRSATWRVMDAQYFELAQRRERVFVVASARDGFDSSQVFLEFEGLRRDFAPGRETGNDTAEVAGKRTKGSHWDGTGIHPPPHTIT